MKSVYVLRTGIAGNPQPMMSEPRYRKATRNMVLANHSLEQALAGLDVSELVADCGFVLGSSHGELSSTAQFLKTLADSGMARPILFQNSLHNSTTGFVAMSWKITGPLLTVSRQQFTGEDALLTAQMLIGLGQCGACLVTGVEAAAPELSILTTHQGDGAATVLLADGDRARKLGLEPLAELLSIQCDEDVPGTELKSGYAADAIEQWIHSLASPSRETILSKSSGGQSVIQWR
jgi:3-oxoacyl-(acyl-carrier-protein) synthase